MPSNLNINFIDPVWETIQKMSLGERYFFRRKISSEKLPMYIKLYDLIVANNNYDETKLKKTLSKQLTESKFTYNKHVLLKKLLESNTLFYIQNDSEMQVLQQIQIVRTLRVKGQIGLAIKNLNKAIDLVTKNEYHSLSRLCINESIRISLFNNPNTTLNDIATIVDQSETVSKNYNAVLLIQSVYLKLIYYRRFSNILLSQQNIADIQKIKQEFLKIDTTDKNINSFKNLYNMCYATIEYLEGNFSNAFKFLQNNIKIWQENKLSILGNVEFYFDTLSLYTDVAILLNKLEEVELVMTHSCNNILNTDYAKYTFQIIYYRCFNRIYNKRGDYKKVEVLLREAKGKLDNWVIYVNTEYRVLLINSVGISCFVLKKYDDAYFYIRQYIQSFNSATRKEIQTFGYLFLVLISYELKNASLFESNYNNAYAHFYRHNNPLIFEKEILHLLKATYNNRVSKLNKEKMEKVLETLEQNKNDPTQQFIFNYFNFPRWIRSKLQRKDYVELVKEELKIS